MNGRTGTYNRLWLPVIEDEGPELRSLRRETRKGRDLGHGAEGVSDGTGRKQGPNANQMRTKCAPNAIWGATRSPPLSSSIFNFDFHFPTCGFMIFVSTSSFISNPSLFIFKSNLDSRDALRGAPPFFYT